MREVASGTNVALDFKSIYQEGDIIEAFKIEEIPATHIYVIDIVTGRGGVTGGKLRVAKLEEAFAGNQSVDNELKDPRIGFTSVTRVTITEICA